MIKNNSVVAIFKLHIEAETAVKELQQAAVLTYGFHPIAKARKLSDVRSG